MTEEDDEKLRQQFRERFNKLATDYPEDVDAWIREALALSRDLQKYCEATNPLRKNAQRTN